MVSKDMLRSNSRPDKRKKRITYDDMENDRINDAIDGQISNTEAFLVLRVDYSQFDVREVLNACSRNDCIATCSNLVSGGDYALELQTQSTKDMFSLIEKLAMTIKGIVRTDVYMSGSRIYPFQTKKYINME